MAEVIRLDRVSLWRRTQEELAYDFKKTMLSLLEGKYRRPARKLVLDNISLGINSGEKIGIIGVNGSGKSTLLKLICGILQPTFGSIRVRGDVAPLLELGAGFDENLSVTDNVIMYGVMLGFARQEMKRRAELILEFAELQSYSFAPVKALSSGMAARLGFAIATDVKPDILILDEVLSVGDESFRRKCEQRVQKFWEAQVTIMLVSHNLEFVRHSCERVIWLEQGKVKMIGEANDTVNAYLSSIANNFLD